MAKRALQIIDTECHQLDPQKQPCTLLDIGGGFPGVDGMGGDSNRFTGTINNGTEIENTTTKTATTTTTTTTVATIARSISPILRSIKEERQTPLTIIAEPGRYFVEGSAVLASKIYQTYTDQDQQRRVYKIPHGVEGVFKDVILCGESFIPQPLQLQQTASNDAKLLLYSSKIIGPSGEIDDVVCEECMLPVLEVGDWLIFDRMGAYTISIASRTGRPITKYVMNPSRSIAVAVNY
jgi:ornithine decarboxylase